ncbi:MAG TPA: DUF2231 domain-containing protein [Prolixibacteraceae bacterium]|nr:DUF2231 domain-containing protein [Prolixibacteraceae bacterium]
MISTDHFHPMLIHFPIALVLFGFLADCVSLFFKKEACLSRLGFYLLILGTITAATALLSGVLFTSEMEGAAGKIQETHEMFAWIALVTLLVTAALRIFLQTKNNENSNLKWISFALYGLAAVAVSITGYFGGTLVYNYMMPL